MLDREIAESALDDPAIKRLLTITGVNLTVAAGSGGGDRRHRPLQEPAEAGELFRPEPAGAAVGARRRPSRPHQQGRPQPRPRHAGRGGLGGGQGARSAARLLRAHPRPARPPDRRGRRGPQAGRALLASADQGGGLSLGAAQPGRPQGPRDGTAGRAGRRRRATRAVQPTPTTSRRCATRRCGSPSRPRRATSISSRPGASARQRRRRAGASTGKARSRRPGDACSRCAALRHEVARARKNTTTRKKVLVDLIRRVELRPVLGGKPM